MTSSLRSCVLALTVLACASEPPRQAPETSTAVSVTLLEAPDATFTRGDVTINYRSIGTGEPVLLVHGYGDNLKMWAGLADSLAASHRVIAVDTRGFGKSSKPAGVANYGQAMVDDLVALLDHVNATQAHVVGYSMGAMLAAELATDHPARVRTVTLAAGSFREKKEDMRAMIAPWVDDLEHGRRLVTLLKQVVPVLPDSTARSFSDQLFAESDSAALVGVMRSFEDLNVDWAKVATSRVPTVAIVGVDDPLRPWSTLLASRWPGAKLVEIPATDHMTIPASTTLLEEIRALVKTNPIRAG